MKSIIYFFHLIVYSNIFLAIGAALLYWGLSWQLMIQPQFDRAFLSFGFTIIFYNLCQFIGIKGKEKKEMSPLQLFISENMTELIFGLFFVLISCIFILIQNISSLHFFRLIALALIGIVYLKYNLRIQESTFSKPVLISVSWAYLPFCVLNININFLSLFWFFIIVVYIFLLCAVYDNKESFSNAFIHKFGIKNSQLFILGIHLILSALFWFQSNLVFFQSWILFSMVSIFLLMKGSKNKNEWWHLTVTDGLIHLFSLLLIYNNEGFFQKL